MKRKITALVLTFAIICGLFSALTVSVCATAVTPTYWSFDGENLTLQPSFNEDTYFIFANGQNGDTYTLPDFFYHEVAVITNNVAVTLPDTDKIGMIAIAGTGSIIRDNLTITNENTTAFTGNASNGNEIMGFYEGNDELYCYTYSGNTTLDYPVFFGAATEEGYYQLNVDGNLTVNCIMNAIEVNVTGNLFIKAPAEGDPNGLNIRTTGYKNGALTVGGTFTADDGQMFLIDEGASVSDNIKLYFDDNGADAEYDITSEHFTKEFCYNTSKAKFMFQGISGGEDELFDFDLRVSYNQDQSLVTYTCGAKDPRPVFDNEKAQFNTADDGQDPALGQISFNIDLDKNFTGSAIPAEEKVADPSISILKITYPRDAEPTEEWIVRAGASTNVNFTFAGNTLSFTPESEAPFELIICLNENEYNYVTFTATEDKKLVEFAVFGNGTAAIDGYIEGVFCRNRAKATLPGSAESVTFTINTEDRFEDFTVDGRYYRVDELPRDGITYNSGTGKITVPLENEQNRYYMDFNFVGDGPSAPHEFQVVYNQERFEVECTNGSGSFELFDHGRDQYPEDMMNPPYITITPKDGYYFKCLLVFTNSGEDYYVNTLEDGNKFTFVNTDIYCVQLIANDETGINYFTARYNNDIVNISKNGTTITPDKQYYFSKNSEMSFNTGGVDPYKVIVRVGVDKAYDITDLYSDGVLKYTPADNFPRTFEFYFTKAEYDCATMNPDPEHNIVELMTWGGGSIEILSANGQPVPAENIAKYNNRYRIALDNTDTTLKVKLNPFAGQSVESVRIDGADQPAGNYAGNVLDINVPENRGYVNSEIVFTNNSGAASGAFSDNLFWEFDDSSKTLTIKGNGKIPDYNYSATDRPWQEYKYTAKHIVIEEGVTGIGSAAFYYMTNVETVSIPSTALTIGAFAFQGLSKLQTLDIPEGVISISQQAFQVLTSLKTLNLPSTLKKFVSNTFMSAAVLESITVAEGNPVFHSAGNCLIETKERKIVLGCTKSVIPTDGSVVSIGFYSFYGSSIQNITIPKQITKIDDHAFTYSALTEIVIPDSITTISDNSFRLCSYLETIYIPSTVTEVEHYAFGDCFALKDVYFCGTEEQWSAITVGDGNGPLTSATVTYHKEGDTYSSDATYHWKVCDICGELLGKEKHTFVNGTCSVCGKNVPKVNFPDVNYNLWYGPSVEYVVASGIMTGYKNGKFGTTDNIQRQDFVVILARLSGDDLSKYEGKASFKDVPKNAYYTAALAWAKDKGVSKGYDSGKFGVGDKVTREQIMTFLYNYAKIKGIDVTVSDAEKTEISSKYSDIIKVSGFAKEATYWALSRGVITGRESGGKKYIAPQANAQRCEVAKMFYNINENNIFG